MSTKNQTMQLKGFDLGPDPVSIEREQPYSDVTLGKHYGMPITSWAFLSMIKRFTDYMNQPGAPAPFRDVFYVEFSKASLFRVLAQEDCEFVRFFFAIPVEGVKDASLAFYGLKNDHKPVKEFVLQTIGNELSRQPVGAGEISEQEITALTGELPPATEEKGNGDKLHPIVGNVKSLKEFYFNNKDLAEGFGDFFASIQ